MKTLFCQDEQRRHLAREVGLNGLDYVEVGDDQLTLTVYFLAKAPPDLSPANVRIDGGRRIRSIRATRVEMCRASDPELDDCMTVTVDRFGDFSTYRLCLVEPDAHGRPGNQPLAGFDPRYACLDFSFKVNCPSDFDCAPEESCPPPAFAEPALNYLAKDYASFRQLILDRLALTMPAWQERHVPDVGIALVELLAYAGDYLSYYQDAVATEAYLDTARLRRSVRRHARLVDYAMHEGCNARAWVCVETAVDVTLPPDVSFITGLIDQAQGRRVLTWDDLRNTPANLYETFAPITQQEQPISVAHNRMHFYTWGDSQCCIARGATSATLLDCCIACPTAAPEHPDSAKQIDQRDATHGGYAKPHQEPPPRALHLNVGDVLIFEELIGPKTGAAADADPSHRHAVRLTAVEQSDDPVTGEPVVEIGWAATDALPFALCISAQGPPPACALLENVSVARGNVMLVDHGRRVRDELIGSVPVASQLVPCDDAACCADSGYTPGRFAPQLQEQPLTYSQPLPDEPSAAALLRPHDPRRARPQIDLTNIPLAPGGAATLFESSDFAYPESLVIRLRDQEDAGAQTLRGQLAPDTIALLGEFDGTGALPTALREALRDDLRRLLDAWTPQPDLLGSQHDDWHFVVETDNDGVAHLRFGDGASGRAPQANTTFLADYRVGNGPSGNVGAETITRIVFDQRVIRNVDLRPRNPLAAWGGTLPESISDVKLLAPTAFRRQLARAITADDYAHLAAQHPGVQRAAGTLRWTGSWAEVHVAVDPLGSETADAQLLHAVRALLEPYRRINHALVVVGATYVPLRITLQVCVLPQHLRAHVEAALRRVLGNQRLPDGTLGLFHPDNLTFGEDVYLSRLVAVAQAVPGVASVDVSALQRLNGVPEQELAEGILRLGPLEIAQLDNDPNFPENGRLELMMEGGR